MNHHTQGNFIDDLIISNGGTGFTNGTYTNLNINGGTGTAAKFNCTISGGAITELTVTDGGSGYDADFTMTAPPAEIGGGSGVIRDIPDNTKVMGYPSKNIREFLRDNK